MSTSTITVHLDDWQGLRKLADALQGEVVALRADKERLDSGTLELTLYGKRMVIEAVDLREAIDAARRDPPTTIDGQQAHAGSDEAAARANSGDVKESRD